MKYDTEVMILSDNFCYLFFCDIYEKNDGICKIK